jgi:fibronectin type 3 domain-containing protein
VTTRPQGNPVDAGSASPHPRGSRKVLTSAVVAAMAMSVVATAITAGTASAAPAAAATSSPLVKYDFNEGTGTTAKDSSGNGFDGTLTGGASWATNGKNYDAVKLDGSSGYVNIPNGPLKGLHDVTMSVDVNLASNKGNDWLGTLGYSTSSYIGMDADAGTLNSYYSNAGKTYEVSTPAPAVGSWTNVTLVVSSTNETMSIYIDGVLKKTTTGLTGDVSTLYDATKTTGGSVGKSVWGGDPYLDATVDDFRVYNSALSDSDVAALAAAAPVAPATPNPVTVSTSPGVAPSLPSTVDVPFTDGTNQSLPVTWGTVDPSQYADAGTFTVKGTTGGASSLEATATVYVLPKPVLTTSAKTGTSVSLKWDAQDNATAYTVLRSSTSGGGYQQVYQGTDTSYTDSGLSLGTNYYYVLNYTVTGGGTSVDSAELPVKTDTKLVGPPTVTQSSYLMTNRVDLSWNAVDLSDSYNVYRSDSADGTYTKLANITGTSYKDSDVDQGSTYYYKVSCVNDAGEGPKSDALKAQTAVDTVPPTTVTSSAQTDSTITLNWLAKDGATNYNLYRTSTSGSGYSLVYSGDALTYTDKNLVTGSTYYYVVTYTSSLGTSVNSKELKVATVAVKVPAPSAIKLITAYTNAAKLSWNSVVGATSFKVYRSTSADGTYSAVKTLSDNTYTDTGLSPGTAYYYELTSVNAAGESAPSAPFKVTTETGTSTILTNKTTWYDDDGNPIQAGSGDIIQVGDTYYWYGGGNGGPFDVNVYSSQDLVHWKFENKVLTTGSLGEDGKPAADLSASSGNHLERIKVIYNASTKKYVMISHYENSDYTLADIGTAESSSPTGDFTWDHSFRPAGLDSRDSTAYVDSDGTGYIISATLTNSKITLFKLTSDYLSVDKQMYNIYGGDNSSDTYAGREAPAMVKNDGVYYLVTSGASGWYPSDAMYSVATADSLADTTADSWKGDTNVDAMGGWDGGGYGYYLGNRNDFGGQSVYILPVTGTHGTSFLLMNDTLDPKASGVGGPLWLPLKLDDGFATVDYSTQIDINAKAGEISNVNPGSLLSQGKPATASSADTTDSDGNVNPDGWTGQYANDGNYNTEWKASSSNYPAWWEVDLGQEYNINDVQLSWWMIGGSEATEDFQIQVSDDGQNWSVGYDLSSGDKQYGFNDCTMPSVEGRYVRVWIIASHTQNNNGGWYVPQLYEARVYGDAAPNSASVTTPDANGNYALQVPANIANYPATGDYTLGLGNVAVDFPTADLLSNLGHGTLTATNGKTPADTLTAVTAAAGSDNKVVSTYDLSLAGADGTNVTALDSPAATTVQLTSDQVASLSASGVTPKLFRYDPGTGKLVDAKGTFDLAKGTVSFDLGDFGTYVVAANSPAPAAQTFKVTTKPVVKGTATVGKTLTATPGSYSVKGVSTAYQWLRNGTPIQDATAATYTAAPADYQVTLSVQVTASKSGYTSVKTTTAATAKVAAGAFKVTTKPVVKGTAAVGKSLTVTPGSYSVKGVSTAYQWLRNGLVIKGATGTTYKVASADKKAKLSVRVTASANGYQAVTTVTDKTATVH